MSTAPQAPTPGVGRGRKRAAVAAVPASLRETAVVRLTSADAGLQAELRARFAAATGYAVDDSGTVTDLALRASPSPATGGGPTGAGAGASAPSGLSGAATSTTAELAAVDDRPLGYLRGMSLHVTVKPDSTTTVKLDAKPQAGNSNPTIAIVAGTVDAALHAVLDAVATQWKFKVDKAVTNMDCEAPRWTPVRVGDSDKEGAFTLWGRPSGAKVKLLKKHGCTMVVTLNSPKELGGTVRAIARKAGAAWVWVPLEGAHVQLLKTRSKQLHDGMRAAIDEMRAGGRVMIHCAAGLHRTGTFAYAVLRALGFASADAELCLWMTRKQTGKGVGRHRLELGEVVAKEYLARQAAAQRRSEAGTAGAGGERADAAGGKAPEADSERKERDLETGADVVFVSREENATATPEIIAAEQEMERVHRETALLKGEEKRLARDAAKRATVAAAAAAAKAPSLPSAGAVDSSKGSSETGAADDHRGKRLIDVVGSRMKEYEAAVPASGVLDQLRPSMARIDGHKFSTFTKGLKRPFDVRMHDAMVATAADLMVQFNASTAYTQSDEITLVWAALSEEQTMPYGGRVLKLSTLLSGYATVRFVHHMQHAEYDLSDAGDRRIVDKVRTDPHVHFDARVFNVPTQEEAYTNVMWRAALDCPRNALSGLARAHMSTREMHGLGAGAQREALLARGVSWEAQPAAFRCGTTVKKHQVEIEAVDRKTGETVKALRTRTRTKVVQYPRHSDAGLTAMLFAKYWPAEVAGDGPKGGAASAGAGAGDA